MSMTLMGTDMGGSIREWGNPQRRVGGIVALATAAIALLVGAVVYFTAGDIAVLDWVLVAILILVLAFIVYLMVATPKTMASQAHAGPAGPMTMGAGESMPSPSEGPKASTITLRCGDCGTVFDIADTGERPLYHTCPGCGAEGVLRDAPAPAAQAQAQPPVVEREPPSPMMATPPPPAPAPVPAPAPAAPTTKRLKLRCGGCKEIFVIEDSGERPLRRPCPHCSRMGESR